MKLKEWVLIWQEKYDAPSVRQSTYEAHRYVLENHILPRLGKWVQISLERCEDFGSNGVSVSDERCEDFGETVWFIQLI